MDKPIAVACPATHSETESIMDAAVPPALNPGVGQAVLEPFPSPNPSLYLQLPLDVARELAGGVQSSAGIARRTETAGGET